MMDIRRATTIAELSAAELHPDKGTEMCLYELSVDTVPNQ
jgi:hypothetical protein